MRKLILLIALFSLLMPASALASGSEEPLLSAAEVFGLINNYRANNGLYALEQDATLMQLAQGQSDYQASIQQVTHGGPGGTRPRDRAYAAGYGGGQVIFISELVTGGFDQSPQKALTWWQNSPEHNSYLLSDNYFELGVGVATDGDGRYYYTAVLGNIATGTTYKPDDPDVVQATAAPVQIPVVRAERRDNGALVHIVRQGQAMWTISAVYEVPLEQIYELNNLNANSFIFPGDEIIIEDAPPATATSEATITPTITPTPAATATPAQNELAAAGTSGESGQAQQPPAPQQNQALEAADAENATVRLIVFLALGSILAVIAASFFVRPGSPEEPDEEFDPFAPID